MKIESIKNNNKDNNPEFSSGINTVEEEAQEKNEPIETGPKRKCDLGEIEITPEITQAVDKYFEENYEIIIELEERLTTLEELPKLKHDDMVIPPVMSEEEAESIVSDLINSEIPKDVQDTHDQIANLEQERIKLSTEQKELMSRLHKLSNASGSLTGGLIQIITGRERKYSKTEAQIEDIKIELRETTRKILELKIKIMNMSSIDAIIQKKSPATDKDKIIFERYKTAPGEIVGKLEQLSVLQKNAHEYIQSVLQSEEACRIIAATEPEKREEKARLLVEEVMSSVKTELQLLSQTLTQPTDLSKLIQSIIQEEKSTMSALISDELFTEASLPITFVGESDMTRLKALSDRLVALGIDVKVLPHEQVAITRKNFEDELDAGDQLYYHSTRQLKGIIETGLLMPRVKVPQQIQIINTGEHSRGVHFNKERPFSFISYFGHRKEKDDPEEVIAGYCCVCFSLSEIVQVSPYRQEKTDQKPFSEEVAYDSLFYAAWEKGSDLYDYVYDVKKGFVIIDEPSTEIVTKYLIENGFNEDWIKGHLISVPLELIKKQPGIYAESDELDDYIESRVRRLTDEHKDEIVVPLRRIKNDNVRTERRMGVRLPVELSDDGPSKTIDNMIIIHKSM
jgi:hypothetical protein